MDENIKREMSIEELEAQYKKIIDKCNSLEKQISKKKQEEKELKESALKSEYNTRKKEVDEALKRFQELKRAFIKDYGYYSTFTNEAFKDTDFITLTHYPFWWF